MDSEDYSPENLRTRYKEKGIQPTRPWVERSTFINNTGSLIEPYVPPEGDGKISPISTAVKSLLFLLQLSHYSNIFFTCTGS